MTDLPYSFLPYLLLLLVSSPALVLTVLTLCGGNSTNRKDKSSAPKTGQETASISSASRASVRVPSQVELLPPATSNRIPDPSPDLTPNLTPNVATPSPQPNNPAPISDYCTSATPTPAKPKISKKESHPVLPPEPNSQPKQKETRKAINTLPSLDSYADPGSRPRSLAESKPAVLGPPLEPISSDPLDRSYIAPVRRTAERAPEIKKGKTADPANISYRTFSERGNTDFDENPFTPSNKGGKKSAEKTPIKVTIKSPKKVTLVKDQQQPGKLSKT